ncbi:uncharacterized protein [Leptinotarsa decemlineata]|uniref:uncharacterized protein n=1 Tax=Leptinotarsa decemlineata TaxID=7539 RepID=UPI003D3054F8
MSSHQQGGATQALEIVQTASIEEPKGSGFHVQSNRTGSRDGTDPGSIRYPSKVSDSTRKSARKSNESKVSSKRVEIERKRLALETEVARTELMREMKKQEFENQMRILDLQKELAEIRIEEKELCSTGDISSRKSLAQSRDKESMFRGVQEWVDKCEVHSVTFSPEKTKIQNTNMSQENDISKLCHVVADAIRSVSRGNCSNNQAIAKELLFFDGKLKDWPLFISQFNRKTNMYQYPEDEVMLMLQRCLKGEALEAVRSLLLRPKNIIHVIETIEMRFGRPEYVIGSLINKTQNLQFVRDGDFNNFVKFSCHVNNLVATLEQFEASNHLNNPFLLEQLLGKLPNSLKLQWGQKMVLKGGKVNLKDFGIWANELSSTACYVSRKTFPTTSHHQKKCNNSRSENILVATNQANDDPKCIYCNKTGHEIYNYSILKNDSIDIRWSKLFNTKICFCCLKTGHSKRFCRSKQRCGFKGCKLHHHSLLHKSEVSDVLSHTEKNDENFQTVCLTNNNSKVLLRIAPIKIYGPKGYINTYALFDEGSTIYLIESQIAEQLGLSGETKPLCMQWTKNIVSYDEGSKCIDMKISGVHEGARIFQMSGLRTVTNLSLPSQTIVMDNFKDYVHLQELPIQDMLDANPSVLIGQDNIHLTVARKVHQSSEHSPIATETILGWVIHGNTSESDQNVYSFHICSCDNNDELNRLVRKSFSTESFGVSVNNRIIDIAHRRTLDILEKNTVYLENEKRYETGLIWKNDNYCNKISDYLKKGYIRKLETSKAIEQNSRTWYLPHFGVVNPNKPNKLRLVFDAAAKSNGTSLNENLLQGPDYLTLLPGVLMHFRRSKWGFCGDITEMFHRVKIRKEDRCAQRFLWRNGEQHRQVDEYELQVMMFGASCSPYSPQYVKNLNAKQSKYPELIKDVERNFYVDDYLDFYDTVQEALSKIERIIELHKNGGFDIVNWSSNSPLVISKYGNEHVEKYFNKSSLDRILGVWWDVKSDSFTIKVDYHKVPKEITDGTVIPTKRQVLQLVMSIFDPLGFLTFLSIKGKIILQAIWRSGIGWDDKIPTTIFHRWLEWLKKIHIFCDSSEEAFAVKAYLRIIFETHIEVSFVKAKARVSPLKPISIPRLELQAAVADCMHGKHRRKTDIPSGELTIQEIDDVKRLCLKRSQEESFGKEIELLKAKDQLDRKSSLFNLSAFIDDDKLLEMQTRISQALCLGEPVKEPVILHPKNATVDLILQHFHEKNHHQGKEMVSNNVR